MDSLKFSDLRAALATAEQERDALKADLVAAAGELRVPIPEPGTDASKMLLANVLMRRDRDEARAVFRDAVHMIAHIARAAGFDAEDPTVEPPAIVARVERLRAERDAARGIAPDDGRRHTLLLHLTPHLLDRVQALGYAPGDTPEGVLPWLVGALEEARLTLAAEQGRAVGAPSAGWEFDGRDWNKNYPDGSFAGLSGRRGKRRWMRALWPDTERAPTYFGRGHDVETDRAAMKCADAAHPSTPETDRP